MITADPVAELLAKLEGVKPCGQGKWSATCPNHDDCTNSLSVSRADDGKCLIHCHANCETTDVLAAVGLKLSDLMVPDPHYRSNGHANGKTSKPSGNSRSGKFATTEKPKTTRGKLIAAFDYTDASGKVDYQAGGMGIRT